MGKGWKMASFSRLSLGIPDSRFAVTKGTAESTVSLNTSGCISLSARSPHSPRPYKALHRSRHTGRHTHINGIISAILMRSASSCASCTEEEEARGLPLSVPPEAAAATTPTRCTH